MPIYKPSELGHYLDALGISPNKRLSQNFLLDGNIIKKIVSLASVSPGDCVLEIGPGPGALTEALLEAGAYVIAVEKDAVLAKGLERFKGMGKLDIYCQDVLEFPWDTVLKGLHPKPKVIANLPYHLTTPIITSLIPKENLLSAVIVMVQEEVARRFAAAPATPEYGSITVFLNFYSKVSYGFKVTRNCFFPKPNVDSAVIKFALQPPPEGISEESFFRLTRTAFNQRRKMLSSSLKEIYGSTAVQTALQAIHKSPKSRPEELSLEEFIALFQELPPTAHSNPIEA